LRQRASFAGTKFGGGGGTPVVERFAFTTGQEARAGREFIFPTPLFLPAPPERSFSKFSVRIFPKKGSDFIQETQHYTIFSFFRSVLRLAASRLGAEMGQISETFFRPGGEKKF